MLSRLEAEKHGRINAQRGKKKKRKRKELGRAGRSGALGLQRYVNTSFYSSGECQAMAEIIKGTRVEIVYMDWVTVPMERSNNRFHMPV